MPKAPPEDHRPARAVLHAPYPLPFVFTRQAPPASIAPKATALTQPAQHSLSSAPTFPAVQHDWREQAPAFPPIPYPQSSSPLDRKGNLKRIRILRMNRTAEESSEWELSSLSGTEEGHATKLLAVNQAVGNMSAGESGADRGDPSLFEHNLLLHAYLSSYKTEDFASPLSEDLPLTPTQADITGSHIALNTAKSGDHESSQEQHFQDVSVAEDFATPKAPPAKPDTPAWDIVSDAASTFWSEGTDADQADEEGDHDEEGLLTFTRYAKQAKVREKENFQPLLLGQTNQMPFTYVPPVHRQPSQSSIGDDHTAGGYASEATSVRTITQIPRSKIRQQRGNVAMKYRIKHRPGSGTPRQIEHYSHSREATPRPDLAHPPSTGHHKHRQPLTYLSSSHARHDDQPVKSYAPGAVQSMRGLEDFTFAPIAPLLGPSEVLSSYTLETRSQDLKPPWSPQPMSIDLPSESETGEAHVPTKISWPRPLPERERIAPTNAGRLLRRFDQMYDVDIPMPTAHSSMESRAAASGSHDYLERGADGTDNPGEAAHVSLGKACHRHLLMKRARKRAGAKMAMQSSYRISQMKGRLETTRRRDRDAMDVEATRQGCLDVDPSHPRRLGRYPSQEWQAQALAHGWSPSLPVVSNSVGALHDYHEQSRRNLFPTPGATPQRLSRADAVIPHERSEWQTKPARKRRRDRSPSSAGDVYDKPGRLQEQMRYNNAAEPCTRRTRGLLPSAVIRDTSTPSYRQPEVEARDSDEESSIMYDMAVNDLFGLSHGQDGMQDGEETEVERVGRLGGWIRGQRQRSSGRPLPALEKGSGRWKGKGKARAF
ncbi:hypothetical protein IAU60_006472 [Kwoniella sp. DSM 27419]